MERRIDHHLKPLVDEDRWDFYRAVAEFSDEQVAPKILSWEREHRHVPDDVLQAMGSMGLFGIGIDEEHGGQGGGQTELVLMGLALAYHSQSVAITPGAALSLGSRPIQNFGTDAQKKAHLSDLASGKRMFVFGLSEPGRGSDAAHPEVVASRTESGWSIRGEKCWSTNAKWASHVVVHARVDPKPEGSGPTTCFLVPMDNPNVHYQEMAGKEVWLQSSTGSIVFDNVEVTEEDQVGGAGGGFKIMVKTLNGGRLFVASLALGSLAFALDKCRQYASERIQFDDKPIGRFQRVQDVLLDMDIALDQGVTWLMQAVKKYEEGTLTPDGAARVKIECSRRASDLLTLAMESCGGVACLDEFGLTRHHRDLFVCRVGEGSNFALKTFCAKPLMPSIQGILQ